MTETAKLGWVIVYVPDVEAAIGFYEKAFGLERRFVAPDASFGELNTGETRLAFASEQQAESNFEGGFQRPSAQPFNIELALVFDDPDGGLRTRRGRRRNRARRPSREALGADGRLRTRPVRDARGAGCADRLTTVSHDWARWSCSSCSRW